MPRGTRVVDVRARASGAVLLSHVLQVEGRGSFGGAGVVMPWPEGWPPDER